MVYLAVRGTLALAAKQRSEKSSDFLAHYIVSL